MAAVLLLAWDPSPGSFTMKGYMLGIAGQIILGKHLLLRPIDLPGNHSTVPCLPIWQIAFALKTFSIQKYCAKYLWGGGRSGE